MDVATAGKPIPNVVWFASTSPFVLSSVVADSKFTTAAIIGQADVDEGADFPISSVLRQTVTDSLVGSRLCALCMPVAATMVLQAGVDLYAHDAIASIACLAHTHPASWGGSFTDSLGRATSIADLTGIDCCADGPIPLEPCCTFAQGCAIQIEKTVGTGVAGPVAVVFCDRTVTFHSSPAHVTVAGTITQESLIASPMDTSTHLVAVDAVLALSAGLTGRPAEAPPTLTHACAIDSVQADPISEADVLRFPWARLALGAKVARAAFSCNDGFHTLWLAP